MLYLLMGVVSLIAIVGAYIKGTVDGQEAAKKAKGTSFDQTLDYLRPVNEFIERELLLEVHRRTRDGRGDITNGNASIIETLSNQDKFIALLTAVTTIVSVNMSKNLKNAFYRIYERDELDTTLMRYINQWCLLRTREMAVQAGQILNVPAGKRDDAAAAMALSLEAEVHNIMGINFRAPGKN